MRYFQWAFSLLLILRRWFCPQGARKSYYVAESTALLCVFEASLPNLHTGWHLPLWTRGLLDRFLSHMIGKTNSTLNQNTACTTTVIWICVKGQGFWSLKTYLRTDWKYSVHGFFSLTILQSISSWAEHPGITVNIDRYWVFVLYFRFPIAHL